MTPVIFRKFKEGDVIAILPTLLGDYDLATCLSYMHVGQHGACEPDGLVQITTLARPEEYASLLKELEGIGYSDLKVYKRLQYKWREERERELRNIGKGL